MSKTRVMPEDLMEMVVAADLYRQEVLSGGGVPCPPPLRHAGLESLFNVIGLIVGQVYVMMPWFLRWRADQKINLLLSGGRTAVSLQLATAQQEVSALALRLQAETGQRPAALMLTSHPDTVGSLHWLRFELVRQGLLLANAVVKATTPWWEYHPRPESFLAIDPFALDTISTPVAGLYSGFMHRIHLVLDRQSRTQGWIQRHILLRQTGYPYIANRLLGRLQRSIPVVMVLPGGLPHNARLFYTAREFVARLPVKHWPYSKRIAQQKWMDLVRKPSQGVRPCESGELTDEVRMALGKLFSEWGISDADQAHWMDPFIREWKLAVPYRERLFRVLIQRLVAQGKPLLWMAIAHSEQQPYVHLSTPWAAYRDKQGTLKWLKGSQGTPETLTDIPSMAQQFSQQYTG